MSESVLQSVKHDLNGLRPEDTHFDPDIIRDINGALVVLNQLGFGTSIKAITGADETWEDILGSDEYTNLIKPWLVMKVKVVFDPPQTGIHMEALNKQIAEYESRINYITDPTDNVLLSE